ncbi:MAG: MBL fold metallo-hydrolase [Armatimonadaceae bacterium]
MILKRFYDDKLAQASYLVGCAATGEAAVVDANRDVEQYLTAAAQEGLRITAVTETHIHADYLSGSRELARRTGATLYLSDEGDADWKYGFAAEENAILVKDGDSFRIGNIRFDIWHTPGHTPEHITFLVTDEPASKEPVLAFTGDFIFVGDVGRPDLLEKAANVIGTMEPGARRLYHSLQRFAKLPDHLQLWPAHGSGSACGKSLGGVPVATLGYERIANWGFGADSEDHFVEMVLSGQPEPPVYFALMKHINKVGPTILNGMPNLARLGGAKIVSLLQENALIVDIRPTPAYMEKHLPGTLHIPGGKLFTNWAGWLIPYHTPFYLLADTKEQVDEAVRDLAMIGLDDAQGWLGPDALTAFTGSGKTLVAAAEITADDLAKLPENNKPMVLDVRGETEWNGGHLPGALHIPLGYLEKRREELPGTDTPIVVHCQGGGRSPIAVSVLERMGYHHVLNLSGGISAYRQAGLPVVTDEIK